MRRQISLALALLLTIAAAAVAHERGAIHLSAPEAGVGSMIGVTADHLSKNARFKFELRGTLDTYTLPEVTSDAKGRFETHLMLPPAASAGSYSLVLIAIDDGDISARADLTIVAAAAPTASDMAAHHAEMAGMEGHAGMPGMDMSAMARARKDMMPLDAKNSGAEWVTIAGVLVLCIAGGLVLLRTPARG